jgi:MFS family permease
VFFGRSGRQTVIPLFADAHIGLGEGAIGLVFALMAGINLLFIIPAGMMVDRVGVKATILPSAILSLVGFAFIAATDSVFPFVLAIMVLGVGSGLLGPAPAAYAAQIAPVERRGAAMGLFRSLGDAGFVISPPLVGYLVDHSGYGIAIILNGIMLALTATIFVLFAGTKRSPAGSSRPATANAP